MEMPKRLSKTRSPSLPNRPAPHVLEERSIAAFKIAKPDRWIFREKHEDYGIDGEVEIFDQNGYTTGVVFLVQMKSTLRASAATNSVRLKVRTLNYFRQLTLPVLIVRWVQSSNQLGYLWAHSLDPSTEQLRRASFGIPLTAFKDWTNGAAGEIEASIQQMRVVEKGMISPPFEIEVSSTLSPSRESLLVQAISSVKETLEVARIPISLTLGKNAGAIVKLSVSDSEIRVGIGGRGGAVLDLKDSDWADIKTSMAPETLIGLTVVALSTMRQDQAAIQLATSFLPLLARLPIPEALVKIAQLFIRNHRISEALQLSRGPMGEHPGFVMPLTSMLMQYRRYSSDAETRELVAWYKEKVELVDGAQKGILHYNIANVLLNKSLYREAFHHFCLAAKTDGSYKQRDYFYRELGACLFELGRYRYAITAYEKALALGLKQDIRHLLADCHFHAGNYIEAKHLLHAYLGEHPEQVVNWVLKLYVATYFVDHLGLRKQSRLRAKRTRSEIELEAIPTLEEAFDRCKPQIERDALDAVVWFNLGVWASRHDKFEFAEMAFLIAGMSNRRDPEAWGNALLVGMNARAPSLRIAAIVQMGYRINGEELVRFVREQLLTQKHSSVAVALDEVFKEAERQHKVERTQEQAVIRLLSKGGYKTFQVGGKSRQLDKGRST